MADRCVAGAYGGECGAQLDDPPQSNGHQRLAHVATATKPLRQGSPMFGCHISPQN
jgi:hypothetical protein